MSPGLPAHTPPFTLPELGKLAREMAVDLRDKVDILRDYNLSEADYENLLKLPTYARLLAALVKEWNSVTSTQDRIKFKSALAFEEGLETLATRMANPNEPLSGAVETGKLLAKIGGIGEGTEGGEKGEKFSINISLGDRKITFENNVRPVQPLPEGESENLQIQSQPTEDSLHEAIRSLAEGERQGLPEQSLAESPSEDQTIRNETETT
jgi:hypothetical protein